jgi:hypothetical protein
VIEHVFGPAASTTTMWRLVDQRIDAAHLPGIRAARASARAAAWAAGAAPAPGGWLHLDVDATFTIDDSDNKENAAATWKKTWGHHSLLVFLDRLEIAGGEALSGLLRPGNAGSNTAADHVTVLEQALKQLPAAYRPDPDDPAGQQILVRSDSAGATHAFATAAVTPGWDSPSATPSTPACATPSRSSTATTAGIRPSSPTAASATAPGSPRPPDWSR